MMKLAVLILLVGAAAANLVTSQRNVIPHHTLHGYGNGVSSRYFDKVETGLGLHKPLGYYGGLGYDGYNNLGLGYGRLGLGNGFLGLGYGGLSYGGLGYGGLDYGRLGYGYGRLGLGY